MKITLLSGRTAWLVGDPHIGRKFEAGVPLDRRGQREARQMRILREELATPDVDYNICVGDVFDHPNVGYGVALQVAEAFLEAAKRRPTTAFIVMAGNHDLPRNLGVVGAFDAFEEIVSGRYPNLYVVRKPASMDELMFFPWEWGVTAEAQVEAHRGQTMGCTAAIGHWDLQSYGGDDSHLAPVLALQALGISQIYSGHYHVEGQFGDVTCTGSMEPYSHGEDPEGKIYVTLTLAEALDGRDLSEKCVRLVLADDEEAPDDLDCMAVTSIRSRGQTELTPINFGSFDWKQILDDALLPLEPYVKDFIKERINA